MDFTVILGWPKNSFGFFCRRAQKNPNELFGQTNISFVCCNLSDVMGCGQTGEGSSSPVLVFSLQPWPHNWVSALQSPWAAARLLVFPSYLFSSLQSAYSIFPYPIPFLLLAWGPFIWTQRLFSWSSFCLLFFFLFLSFSYFKGTWALLYLSQTVFILAGYLFWFLLSPRW